jgi:hypothetical protein
MKKTLVACLLVIAPGCTDRTNSPDVKDNFTKDLEELREYFHIPGIAVIVTRGDQTLYENYLGLADIENNVSWYTTGSEEVLRNLSGL